MSKFEKIKYTVIVNGERYWFDEKTKQIKKSDGSFKQSHFKKEYNDYIIKFFKEGNFGNTKRKIIS